MNRAAALAEAHRRWGELAWICGPKRTEPRYAVGFVSTASGQRHEMGRGATWEDAFAAADAAKARGFDRTYVRLENTVVVVCGERPPTWTEAEAVLAHAEAHGILIVEWQCVRGIQLFLRRCVKCGNVSFGSGPRCRVCIQLDELFDPGEFDEKRGSTPADLEAQHQAAERYMDRIGALVVDQQQRAARASAAELQRILDGQARGGEEPS